MSGRGKQPSILKDPQTQQLPAPYLDCDAKKASLDREASKARHGTMAWPAIPYVTATMEMQANN
jgi:hypothetical protein